MSGLTTIKLSSEELKKEQERQRKRGKLILNHLKKGKVKVSVYEGPDITFHYQIHSANFRPIVDYTNGEVICTMDCWYDDVDIFNEDGSEITEKLPLWLVAGIESELENKFDKFNIEINFKKDMGGGKVSVISEDKSEDQRMIDRVRVIYRILKKGGKMGFDSNPNYHEVHWTLPNKFYVKIKHHDKDDAKRYKLTVDSYPILLLNTETINYTKTNEKPIRNGEKHLISGEITNQFKKYGITVYWGGQVPKYSIFSPNSVSPDETYTEIDITPKSK